MKTLHDNVEAALDALEPAEHPSRDATHFRRVVAAADDLQAAEKELHDVVTAARAAGESWTVIGAALGVSRQAAQQRFS